MDVKVNKVRLAPKIEEPVEEEAEILPPVKSDIFVKHEKKKTKQKRKLSEKQIAHLDNLRKMNAQRKEKRNQKKQTVAPVVNKQTTTQQPPRQAPQAPLAQQRQQQQKVAPMIQPQKKNTGFDDDFFNKFDRFLGVMNKYQNFNQRKQPEQAPKKQEPPKQTKRQSSRPMTVDILSRLRKNNIHRSF